MGYHAKTRCTVLGEKEAVNRFRGLCFHNEGCTQWPQIKFDFERVIPIPPEFSRPALAQRLMGMTLEMIDQKDPWESYNRKYDIELAQRDWCSSNWVSESIGYHVSFERKRPFEFVMQTDGGFPESIFAKVAEIFPTLSFNCAFYGLYELDYDCDIEGYSGDGGSGWFNPPPGEASFRFGRATDELVERVEGVARNRNVRTPFWMGAYE